MSLNKLLQTFKEEKVIVEELDGKFVEKDTAGISLKGVLQRGRLKMGREKVSPRMGLSFSPSMLTYKYCRRLKIAQLAGLVELYYDKVTPSVQTKFDMGHLFHDLVQGWFWDIGILKGSYKCFKCEKIYHDLISPEQCPSGIKSHTRKSLKFKEVIMKEPTHLLSGRCDGILMIDGEEHLFDIKSIQNRTLTTNERQFCFEDLELQGPKLEHIVQLTLYMFMSAIHKGHLLYISKNIGQIKTYAIPYSIDIIVPYLDEIAELMIKADLLNQGTKVSLPKPCDDEKCQCHKILGTPQLEG